MFSKLLDKVLDQDTFGKVRKKFGWKKRPREYVSKEIDKKIREKEGDWRFRSQWRWWWFSFAWADIKAGNLREPWLMTLRGANFRNIWIGPLLLQVRVRYLMGPAMIHHKEFFKD